MYWSMNDKCFHKIILLVRDTRKQYGVDKTKIFSGSCSWFMSGTQNQGKELLGFNGLLQNGTNGDFGRVLVPRKLHVYTISSLHYQVVAKREFLRMCFRAKRFLHADAFAVDSYWPVTRTAVGGHFCATQHGGRACKQVRLLRGKLSRCWPNKCIFFLTSAWVQTLRENKMIRRVVIKTDFEAPFRDCENRPAAVSSRWPHHLICLRHNFSRTSNQYKFRTAALYMVKFSLLAMSKSLFYRDNLCARCPRKG